MASPCTGAGGRRDQGPGAVSEVEGRGWGTAAWLLVVWVEAEHRTPQLPRLWEHPFPWAQKQPWSPSGMWAAALPRAPPGTGASLCTSALLSPKAPPMPDRVIMSPEKPPRARTTDPVGQQGWGSTDICSQVDVMPTAVPHQVGTAAGGQPCSRRPVPGLAWDHERAAETPDSRRQQQPRPTRTP